MTSKFALVIANTEYQDASFAKLTAPGKDAEEFAHILRDPELAAFDDVQVLLNEGEGKTRRLIARFFAERKRDDLLLLYFSGHGMRNDVGQLFLAAHDTEINILEASGIPAEFVTQSMNSSRSQRQLLILDCCNSGAFGYGSKSASAVGKSMGIASAFEGSGFGRVVLTATDATQYAWEGEKVIGDTQKSVFTHFLIEGLKGEADRDGDGKINVDELYDYTYEQIVRRTPKQTPGKWSYKQQGDIVLCENLQPREVKPAPLPAELLEMLSHSNAGVRRTGIQDLISLLNGKHLGLARAAEGKLREIAENDDSLTLRRSASEALIAHGIMLEQPGLENLSSQAIQYELKGDFWNALQTYYKIKKVDPLFPRVDIKIKELEKELRPTENMAKSNPVSVIPQQKKTVAKFNPRLIGGIAGVLLIGIFFVLANSAIANKWFTSNTTTPTPGIGSTLISDKDGMILLYVPAGEFSMGSENSVEDELPVHTVNLNAFWIDQTEVTVRMYYLCVEANVCKEPTNKTSYTQSSYYGNAQFDNYPVIYVDWKMAKTYCEWAGRRLPTEAEWEKAARGTDENIYPWGNESPNENLLNYNSNIGDTTEVGKYPNAKNIYGALDMAGNVLEWVSSLYQPYPYNADDGRENLNSSEARVLRSNSWSYLDNNRVFSASRYKLDPARVGNYIGFRCATSTTP